MKKLNLLLLCIIIFSACSDIEIENKYTGGVIVCSGSFAHIWLLAGGELLATTSDFFENNYGKTGKIEDIGGLHSPNLEKILALNPNKVILSSDISGHVKLKEPLTSAGIETKYYSVEVFNDYISMLKDFTEITERNDLYVSNGINVQNKINKIINKSSQMDISPRILLVRAGAGKISARSGDTMAGAMLAELGCINIADTKNGLLNDLSMEIIIREDPDFIFATIMGDEEKGLQTLSDIFEGNPAWSNLSAVKNNRYILLPKDLFHLKPNNRWAESYNFLIEFLYDVQMHFETDEEAAKIRDMSSGRIITDIFTNKHEQNKQALSASRNVMPVDYISFNPVKRQAVSTYHNSNIVKLWDFLNGREIKTFTGDEGQKNLAAFNNEINKNVSGLWDISTSDGTIRILEASSKREIAQFVTYNDGEWIVLTPDGYYNASPNGDKYLNIRVDNKVYGINQYRSTFFRPQIVEERLQGAAAPMQLSIQKAEKPPVVVIHDPLNGAVINADQAEISVTVESKQAIKNIQFFVNGRLINCESISCINGYNTETTGITFTENQNRLVFKANFKLDHGNNYIEVIASNSHEGYDSIEVFSHQPVSKQNTLPNLRILSIGINNYNSPLLDNLKFAVNDAKEIINFFKNQEGTAYSSVNSRIIADGEMLTPVKKNITDGLNFLKEADENDTIILFIAGHGILDENGSFFLMPSDASFNQNGSIKSSEAISLNEIKTICYGYGRKIILIDACHSAGENNNMTRILDNTRLAKDLESRGSVIVTAGRNEQPSQEHENLKHGVFTYAILQGLAGEAQQENGVISMTALYNYIKNKVRNLTDNAQEPTLGSIGYYDFPVAGFR